MDMEDKASPTRSENLLEGPAPSTTRSKSSKASAAVSKSSKASTPAPKMSRTPSGPKASKSTARDSRASETPETANVMDTVDDDSSPPLGNIPVATEKEPSRTDSSADILQEDRSRSVLQDSRSSKTSAREPISSKNTTSAFISDIEEDEAPPAGVDVHSDSSVDPRDSSRAAED